VDEVIGGDFGSVGLVLHGGLASLEVDDALGRCIDVGLNSLVRGLVRRLRHTRDTKVLADDDVDGRHRVRMSSSEVKCLPISSSSSSSSSSFPLDSSHPEDIDP
jgi:hypothetical protein